MKTLSTISISKYARNIKIEDRGTKGVFAQWSDPYDCFRIFGDIFTAEKFASGEKISFKLPTKSKRLPISSTASKPSQFENWTERMTRDEVTTETLIGYHFGFSGKELSNVETCFYGVWPSGKTQVPPGCIMVEIPAGTKIEWYETEFRVVLTEGMKAWKLKSGWLKSI